MTKEKSTEVAEVKQVFGGVAVRDVKALAAKAQQAAQNTPRGNAPGGSDYMNFSGKRGVYTIGSDKRKIENDELWVVDVSSFEEGFVAWKAGRPAGKRMSNIYTGVPVPQPEDNEGGPYDMGNGEGWHQAKSMVVKSLDTDQQGYFTINSVSGVDAMAKFIGNFASRAAAGEPAWPVMSFDMEEFSAQGHKNFKPVFTEVAWLDDDQMEQLGNGTSIEDLIDLPEVVEKPAPVVTARRRR